MTVGETILQQLGGNRFRAMTGAKSFTSGPKSLSFRISRAKNGISGVLITLTAKDDYIVKFLKPGFFRKGGAWIDGKTWTHEGVYAENLQAIFTEATGLYTHL